MGASVALAYGDDNEGVAYGDPHFMVLTSGQEPICFDYNPAVEDDDMNLIVDPVTNLIISASLRERRQGRLFMDKITILSPQGAHVEIDSEGVTVFDEADGIEIAGRQPATGIRQYADIHFVEHWSEDGGRDRVIIEITDGPSFVIKDKIVRKTLSFVVTDTTGLSEKCKGIIGQFVKPNAYQITRVDQTKAVVTSNGIDVDVVREDFHRNHMCWTISDEDILMMLQ